MITHHIKHKIHKIGLGVERIRSAALIMTTVALGCSPKHGRFDYMFFAFGTKTGGGITGSNGK